MCSSLCRVMTVIAFVGRLAAAPVAADGPLFDYRQIELDNGLKVITLEDFSCPIVAVHLWYHVGSKDEHPERQGFAHMFEHMMFRGTDRLGPTDHFDYIHRTGGDCNAYTAFDQTVYVQTVPANQLEMVLHLEAERMAFLKIDQEAFDTERKVVEEERRLWLNRPYGTVPEKILPEIFTVHPYRWLTIGNIAHLRAASVAELREFWTRYYVPNNATLVIVGAVKHEDAHSLARKTFGWIPRYPDPPRVTVREPMPTESKTITIKADNAPSPVVGMVFRTVPAGHDDYVPIQMLASILGGGPSSRLYRKIVAEDQSAVIAAAGAYSLEHDGGIGAGAVLAPFGGDPKKVLATIEAEITRLREERVTSEELDKARNQMLKGVVMGTLTVESKASLLGNAAVVEGDVSRVNRQIDDVRRVTTDDLLRVAREYLAPDRAYRVTVERNLLGMLLGRAKSEEAAPITATPETDPPPPGRPGLQRPAQLAATPPMAPPLETIPRPDIRSTILDNGLKVVVVRNAEVPFVTMQLGLLAGGWTEDKPGTANMALAMLTKGTQGRTEAQLAAEGDRYAISLGGSANMDTASVSASCVRDQASRAMELLADVVLHPTFPEDEFEKLRRQTRTGLAIASAEPSYIADRELRRRLFGTHPYSRTPTGEVEDLDALVVDDLSAWWTRIARPADARLIIAGDVEFDAAVAMARSALGGWKSNDAGPSYQASPPAPAATGPTHIYLVDRQGPQSQIRFGQIGMTRAHPGYFTSRVVSGYFGGAFGSRLNETIRVKRGLTYGASGGWSAERFAGTFRVSTFSKNETTVAAVKAIFEELERLRGEPPAADELARTKSYIIGSFPGDRETPQQVAGDVWLRESLGLPDDYFDRMLSAVRTVTADQCAALAREALDPQTLVVVVVGPASQLKDELAAVAPVTVVGRSEPVADDDAEAQEAR